MTARLIPKVPQTFLSVGELRVRTIEWTFDRKIRNSSHHE